jgi:signal transduction histidine kinase
MSLALTASSATTRGVPEAPRGRRLLSISSATAWIAGGWILLVGGYVAGALLLPAGDRLTAFGDVIQCFVPLLANTGLLLNAASPRWRQNWFWLLFALSCTLWMAGQILWTHYEVFLHQPNPNPFSGDPIFFFHTVPMIAALTLLPHLRRTEQRTRHGVVDFGLLLVWWTFLYLFFVIPWQHVVLKVDYYDDAFNYLYLVENSILLAGLAALCWTARGAWRRIYCALFFSFALYLLGSTLINMAIDRNQYHTGSLFDVPLVASFAMFGTAGLVAYRASGGAEAPETAATRNSVWPSRLAMAALASLPLFALWNQMLSDAPAPIRRYRLLLTLATMLPFDALVFWRQHLVNCERQDLLRTSEESLENLRRLQNQLVQTEKLSSLGQLAAGAAHEINNPLTAILGFTDVLEADRALAPRYRALVEKIRAQALRTKSLVTSLLSFARQVPAEKVLLDVNQVLASAVQLRSLDLRDKRVKLDFEPETLLPGVRGDPNQLLQVFFHIINNAVDALEEVGGGVLAIRTLRERNRAVVEFSDTGPGLRDPKRVFDPFYTTKPVGKGSGLGLSICYGILQEHGGEISCFNRPEGGATFRVELPVLPVIVPQPVATYYSATKNS